MFQTLWSCIYLFFRPLVKWFLRKTTHLCELQRLCYGEPPGAARSLAVERSLQLSSSIDVKQLISYLDKVSEEQGLVPPRENQIIDYAVFTVLRVKGIKPEVHRPFLKSFATCVTQLWGYKQLLVAVDQLRKTAYDSENEEHEQRLLMLWNTLVPCKTLESRVTKQWQDVGFQGDDPKTDFRGMGLLGLENLLYFATEYHGAATHVLAHSHHPKYGYSFAIVGINLSNMAYQLLKDGAAKVHIYNLSIGKPVLKHFHQLYCYLFYEFDRFWLEEKPRDVMEFSRIRDKFNVYIRNLLQDTSTVFKINVAVDRVSNSLELSSRKTIPRKEMDGSVQRNDKTHRTTLQKQSSSCVMPLK